MEDAMVEVFLRLPAKSLTRCKCLSKKWHHFISYNTPFHRSYLSRLNGSPLLLGFFFNRSQSISTNYAAQDRLRFFPCCTQGFKLKVGDETLGPQALPHPFDESLGFLGHETVFVVASSNGFLLCCLEEYHPVSYYICNPVTREWVALPKPNMTSQDALTGFLCNGSYPRLDMVSYKVIRGMRHPRILSNTLTVEVFSSESFDWKVYNMTCASSFRMLRLNPYIVVNESGVVHWLGLTETRIAGAVVFDQSKECLELIAVPGGNRGIGHYRLAERDGQVLFVAHNLSDLEIFSLDENDDCGTKEWSLRHRVSLGATMEKYPGLFSGLHKNFQIIRFHPSNPQLLLIWVNHKIACYNLENSTVEVVCDFPAPGLKYYYYIAYVWPSWPPFFL